MTSVQHVASATSCANNNQTANALKKLLPIPYTEKELVFWISKYSL